MMLSVKSLDKDCSIALACNKLSLPRASYYRFVSPQKGRSKALAKKSPLALSSLEQDKVLNILRSEKYVDMAPAEVFSTLLDEGTYLCSVRTMYRLLHQNGEVGERRSQRQNRFYKKPELLAKRPNEVWSWDITKLKGPAKWTYFYLYVIMDIFSRFVVGWMIAHRESASLAETLIDETAKNQRIQKNQLTIHADRGSSMRSKPVAFLMADLGITKSHSRPYQSNDNPYSEAQFKTLKYNHAFPKRFYSIAEARQFCSGFFDWYNHHHRHSGIAMMTPASIHDGSSQMVLEQRNRVLKEAFTEHPNRFKFKVPMAKNPPTAAWINKPDEKKEVVLEY